VKAGAGRPFADDGGRELNEKKVPVTARSKLRQALSEELVPVLLNRGFAGPAKIGGNSLLHEYRRTTESGVQVLSIQLEKNQLPRFVLNLHLEPKEGIERVIAEGGTVLAGCLKAKPGPWLRSWLRADRSWWQRVILGKTDTLEREAVRLCLASLPEVEAWWNTQAPSKHIMCWPVRYRGTSTTGT
jgi:hypothetical protein